jgi:hypothetical protein
MCADSASSAGLREKFASWEGKRVTVATVSEHYISGTWRGFDGDRAVFQIGLRELQVPLVEVQTVIEATPYQADYFK